MTWESWVALVALVVAVVTLFIAVWLRGQIQALTLQLSSRQAHAPEPDHPRPDGPICVIYNPSKDADFDEMKRVVRESAADAGFDDPIWLPTTIEDPGNGQVRQAVEMGASVVIAAGGDGTVRVVAGELAGTGIPLGMLPIGTGNLLARNLGLPLDSIRNLASVAVTGRSRRVDVGWMEADQPSDAALAAIKELDSEGEPFVGKVAFVVIAGLGFDAQVMGGADDDLKRVLGWSAYVVSGVKHLKEKRLVATVATGSHEIPIEARSIMFANCGGLPGGLMLAPDARIDDGWLDIAVLDTKAGIWGWGDLVRRIGLQKFGVQDKMLPETGSIDFRRTQSARVKIEEPEQVQADGDPLGWATDVTATVQKGALLVRVG
ncbi:MAG: diacylglycerol/lipid kinase family protein [Ancrocorticia sp.]|uniref:diacylglycerol/lipid kinase family protein n=1 Tax=Ancrocorticia sp. TaxID=2593684 RepID=UPI003F8F5CE5